MSVQRIGGACAVVVGLSYVLVGITYLLLPNEQRPESPSATFLPSYAANPTFARLINWETALGALFAVGAVMAITELVREAGPGLARWTGNLAVIGFAATAISGFRALAVQPLMASSYVAADASAKAAIVANANPNLDPDGWLAFGVVGVWAPGARERASSTAQLCRIRSRRSIPRRGRGERDSYRSPHRRCRRPWRCDRGAHLVHRDRTDPAARACCEGLFRITRMACADGRASCRIDRMTICCGRSRRRRPSGRQIGIKPDVGARDQ